MAQSIETTSSIKELKKAASNRTDTPNQMKIYSIKQGGSLDQKEIHIKTEPCQDENEIKLEMFEPIVEIKTEDPLMDEPLPVNTQIEDEVKAEKHSPKKLCNDADEPTKTIESKEYENHLETDEKNSDGTESNKQNQLSITYKKVSVNRRHACFVCNKKFLRKSLLDTHFRIHTGEKPFKCEICEESFTQKGQLDRHMKEHTAEGPYICDVCKMPIKDMANLKRHKRIHIGDKPFSCNECNKSFARNSDLVRHKFVHIDKDLRPNGCLICNKSYLTKSQLEIHLRIHTGDKPYVCNVCNKSFAYQSNLTQHSSVHTGEKPFSCEICRKSFSKKAHVQTHLKTMHNKR